jgi:ferredoxin
MGGTDSGRTTWGGAGSTCALRPDSTHGLGLQQRKPQKSAKIIYIDPLHKCAFESIMRAMATESETVRPAGMVPAELKHEPRSKGISTPRKKKPKELAVITECCTGCAGSPACVEYCPVEDCMFWVPDEDHPPFGRIQVDPVLCIGCKKCVSKGPDGCFLDGCPWDAIVMLDIAEVEKVVGAMSH